MQTKTLIQKLKKLGFSVEQNLDAFSPHLVISIPSGEKLFLERRDGYFEFNSYLNNNHSVGAEVAKRLPKLAQPRTFARLERVLFRWRLFCTDRDAYNRTKEEW